MYCHFQTIIFFIITSCYGQVYQRITFFSEPSLGGNSETLENSQPIASALISSAKSFCSELGLWQLTIIERTTADSTSIEFNKVYGGSYGATFCVNTIPAPPGKTWELKSVECIGERDLTVSSLTLFDNANFLGPSETLYLSEGIYEPELTFKSYFLTGKTNWAVFTGNLTGKETCLKSLTDGGATHGARAEAYLNPSSLTIQSYRQGCEGDGDSPVIRPPGGGSGSDTVLLNNFLLFSAFILGFSVLRGISL